MKVNYGQDVNPPTLFTAIAFGSDKEPVPLEGGFGTSYLAESIVLKPSEGDEVSSAMAEIFHKLPETPGVRLSRPVRSVNGDWVHDGYVARYFLKGDHVRGKYAEKLKASREFHKLLKNMDKPDFLKTPRHSWSVSHDVALGRKDFDYGGEFSELYEQIKPHLKPLDIEHQLVHGDLAGNFLYEEGLPPAIIDFSPAWAPEGFAEGIMLADVLSWEDPTEEELEVFKEIPNIKQLAWRGVLARIAEQAEHIKWFDKEKEIALKAAKKYKKAIDFLKTDFFE